MTTINTEAFRRIEADETGFSVTCTSSDVTLEVALTVDERRALADALTSGSDPAVYVVRESDIGAVEIERDDNGNWRVGSYTYHNRTTADGMRNAARIAIGDAAAREAVARRIEAEQAVDPVDEQTDALADILYGHEMVTDQMRGVLERVVRAGMLLLEQEADQ